MGLQKICKVKLSRTLIISTWLIAAMLGVPGCDEDHSNRVVVIGGLFSLTGNWATLGQASRAAMEIAIEDVNADFAANSIGVRFGMRVEDTELIPSLALEQLEDLYDSNIKVVIGPQSSSEVRELKDFADGNGIIIVSQSSTAGSLSISGDNIFRLSPDDIQEGMAVATLMRSDGIATAVPIWRDDTGNDGLEMATRESFESTGGMMTTGIEYAPDTMDFSTQVADLSAQVSAAIAADGIDHVAIYLAGFDEVVKIFELAKGDPVLSSVRWYGSDGVVFSEALLANTGGSSEFAEGVIYTNPIFGLDASLEDEWGPIAEEISERSGVQPDAFALSVYDAVWLVALAYSTAEDPEDAESFKAAFLDTANAYMGITGPTALNAAGDREIGDFDFWGVRKEGDIFVWKKVATYDGETGTVMYVE